MKLSTLLATGATLAMLAVPAMAQEAPNLVGTWKGTSDGIGKEQGWLSGDVVLEVTEQKGRSFKAKISYPDAKGAAETEELIGTITPGGKDIFLVDEDGIHIASLEGGNLDSCYLEADDDDAMAVCVRFAKQP